MSSPSSLRHSVSETKLSPKSHMIASTSRSTTLSSNPPSSLPPKTVTKLRLRRKTTDDHVRTCDHEFNKHGYSCSLDSPYYKGLLDQSLVINTNDGSQDHPQNHLNSGHNNNLLSSAGQSPYYKGLTDFSLVLHGRQDLQSHHDYADWRIHHEVEGAYGCSPYYKGLLTDYYMATRKLDEGGGGGGGSYGHGGVGLTNVSSFMFNMNLGLCLGCKDEIFSSGDAAAATGPTDSGGQRYISSLSPPLPISLPSPSMPLPPSSLSMFPSKGWSMEPKVEGQKPLGERVSEENNMAEEKALDMKEKEEAANEYDFANEKEKKVKSLRESVSNISEQTVFASSESSSEDVTDQEIINEEEEEESLKKYAWAHKYQPKALSDFICHKHIVAQLLTMVKEVSCCKHFIFEGPPGVGKRTMIRALIREVFGHEGVQVTEEWRTFILKGETMERIQVPIKKSKHHVEVNLSQTKGYERQVVVDLLREAYDKIIPNTSLPCSPQDCQAIIIYEAEKLSTESLLYIKWMLERYHKDCNKVFFCCSDESKLQIVKPLCNTFRLSPPSTQEIVEVLKYIGEEEGKELSLEFLVKVVDKSRHNLRQAIRSLEATCQNKDSIKDDEYILTGWEDDISNIAKNILQEQSSKQLYMIHVKLHSLMIHKVSPDFVYKYLMSELNSRVDESLRPGLEKLKKEYNQNVHEVKLKSGKHSGHAYNKERESDERNNELPKKNIALSYSEVEEFIAKFMSWYKPHLQKMRTS